MMTLQETNAAIKRVRRRIYFYRENRDREGENYALQELSWLETKQKELEEYEKVMTLKRPKNEPFVI